MYSINSKGSCFRFCNPICPPLVLPEMDTLSVWLQRAAADWVHRGTGVPHLTRFLLPSMLKAIPGQANALCTGQGSVLCLGLRKFQMCQYFTNFIISDPNESFVFFLKLFHKVSFHCYAAIVSPATRGQNGKYQQLVICFFLLNVSNCLQPVCLSASVVWCHVPFSCLTLGCGTVRWCLCVYHKSVLSTMSVHSDCKINLWNKI